MNTFKFDSNNKTHQALLKLYVEHPNTPYNNSTLFLIEQYDDVNGVMFMIEDKDQIVATYGVLLVELETDVVAAKLSRLHIREDYRDQINVFLDQYLDPMIYEWLDEKNIRNMIKTVNIGNENVMMRAWKRLPRKRSYGLDYLNDHGKALNKKSWTILPYLINEKEVWQYCTWVSLDDVKWKSRWRETSKIDDEVVTILNNNFSSTSDGWVV